jgi:hypothetical protein
MTENNNKKSKKPRKPKDPNRIHKSTGRKHSQETKNRIAEKRKARTVQPRNISQSNKRTTFYHELENDWQTIKSKKNSDIKAQKIQEALEWIEANKVELGYIPKEKLNNREMVLEQYDKYGLLTEYLEMYNNNYEERIPDVLFNDERAPANVRVDDPWEMIDSFSDSDSDFSDDFAEIFCAGGGLDE